MEQRFSRALTGLQRLLVDASHDLDHPIRFALIGGLAVSAWGVVRATEDIDLLADSDPSPLTSVPFRDNLKRFFERRKCGVEWRIGEPDDPIPLLLRVTLPQQVRGLKADILWAHKRWQRDALARVITIKISRTNVLVLHPEDLVVLKLEAGGPQDLLDVEELLYEAPAEINLRRLTTKASELGLETVLENCLRSRSGRTRKR